jgi:hypothetical protein
VERYAIDSPSNHQLLTGHTGQFQSATANNHKPIPDPHTDFTLSVFRNATVIFNQNPTVTGQFYNALSRQQFSGKVSFLYQSIHNSFSPFHAVHLPFAKAYAVRVMFFPCGAYILLR